MEPQGLRRTDRVVRPIAAATGRTCARPGCPAPARSTLTFAYESKRARLVGLLPDPDPASYDLCGGHADRTSPPFGWTLSDDRPPEPDGTPVDLADPDRTVAVISAALRAVPAEPEAPAGDDAIAQAAEVDGSRRGSRRLQREPRPVPAAVEAGTLRESRAGPVQPAADVRALTEPAEVLSGAEVEVVLDELAGLHAVADQASAELPLDFGGAVDEDDPGSADDLDDVLDDGPLSPEGHAQVW